jgi:hypothetical protein
MQFVPGATCLGVCSKVTCVATSSHHVPSVYLGPAGGNQISCMLFNGLLHATELQLVQFEQFDSIQPGHPRMSQNCSLAHSVQVIGHVPYAISLTTLDGNYCMFCLHACEFTSEAKDHKLARVTLDPSLFLFFYYLYYLYYYILLFI